MQSLSQIKLDSYCFFGLVVNDLLVMNRSQQDQKGNSCPIWFDVRTAFTFQMILKQIDDKWR